MINNNNTTARTEMTEEQKQAFLTSLQPIRELNPTAFCYLIPRSADVFEWKGFELELIEAIREWERHFES